MTDLSHMKDEDPFADLKKSQRDRIWQAIDFVCKHNKLRRRDLMEMGEVSEPQASIDIRMIMQRMPNFMQYDRQLRMYVLTPSGNKIQEPTPAMIDAAKAVFDVRFFDQHLSADDAKDFFTKVWQAMHAAM